jgi:hypothetical protein
MVGNSLWMDCTAWKATSQGHDFWGSETEYSLEVRVMMIPSYQPQSTVRTSLQDWCVAELQKTKLETQDHGASWGQIIFRTRILPFWGSKVKSRLYIPVYPFISFYVYLSIYLSFYSDLFYSILILFYSILILFYSILSILSIYLSIYQSIYLSI